MHLRDDSALDNESLSKNFNGLKRIIGIAGRICSGKDAVAEYVTRVYDAERMAVSDTLYAALRTFGIPESRYGSQLLSTFLRDTFGQDILEKALLQRIHLSEHCLITVTSIRRKQDIEKIREAYDFNLLFISASQEMRYEWYKRRNKGDGDYGSSFADFCKRDTYETEKTIDDLRNEADYCIENIGMLDDLIRSADAAVRQVIFNNGNTDMAGKIAPENTPTS